MAKIIKKGAYGLNLEALTSALKDFALTTGVKIIFAIFFTLAIFRIINLISRKTEKKLLNGKHRHADKTLVSTLFYVGRIALKTVVLLAAVGYLGIDTSGMTALIASLGVGFGLAVNGALSNLAGGAIILITRPFRVDDFIEAEGYSGTVEDIRMTNTRLRTPDNKVVYIPNGKLSSGTIVNYSEKDIRRVDFSFSIGYECDFDKAKNIIMRIFDAHNLILREKDTAPLVRVSAHGESAIEITARCWVKSNDYFTVKFDVLESVKREFDECGITIPYKQLDVHLVEEIKRDY